MDPRIRDCIKILRNRNTAAYQFISKNDSHQFCQITCEHTVDRVGEVVADGFLLSKASSRSLWCLHIYPIWPIVRTKYM